MKTKKILLSTAAILMLSLMLLTPVLAFPTLPGSVTVVLTVGATDSTKWPGTVAITGGSGDLPSGSYVGWCNDFYTSIQTSPQSYTATPITNFAVADKINYLLNTYPTNDFNKQVAIWLLIHTNAPFNIPLATVEADIAVRYGGNTPAQPSATAIAMYNDANTNGVGFVPATGQLVAVDLIIIGAQSLIVTITQPCGQPGLTPGFWKHNVGVYLTSIGTLTGKDAVNGGYSDPTGATEVTKDSMGTWLPTVPLPFGMTLLDMYNALNFKGGGSAGAAIRNNAANVFNVAAGLAPGPPWN